MVMAGGAVATACEALGERVKRLAAHLLQVEPEAVVLRDGGAWGPGGGRVSLADIGRLWYRQPENLPEDADPRGLEVTEGYRAVRDSGTFSYACHACVVEVDVETGGIEILDYVVVEDGGVLVNPMIVDGQVLGGAAQGIGTALYEEMPFDEAAQPLASTLADYRLPGAAGGTRDPDRAHGDALPLQPFRAEGARRGRGDRAARRDRERDQQRARTAWGGSGRAANHARAPAQQDRRGVIVTPGASTDSNALAPLGVEVDELPITRERLLDKIAGASR